MHPEVCAFIWGEGFGMEDSDKSNSWHPHEKKLDWIAEIDTKVICIQMTTFIWYQLGYFEVKFIFTNHGIIDLAHF